MKKKDGITREINNIQKPIPGRGKKHRQHRELSLRLNELNISTTEIRKKIDTLKQKISNIEEVKQKVSKLIIKELKKKIKNLPPARLILRNMLKGENEIDFGLFFGLADENKIIYNQTPVNTVIEDMENLKIGFFANGYSSLGDAGEIDTNRFFKDCSELAKFIDKILDKYDDHPSIYYPGKVYRYFKKFKRVNRSENGRGAKEFINFLEYEGEQCFIPIGNACFICCNKFFLKKDFSKEYFEFIQSYKRRTNVRTRYRLPKFCERCKIHIGIYDIESKRILLRNVKQRDVCVYLQKNHYCVVRKKNGKDSLFNGVEEIERKFSYVRNKIIEKILKQKISDRFTKHETIGQLDKVFVFELGTYNDQQSAAAYAAGLNDVNRMRDRWNRDLTPHEIVTEKNNAIVFDGSNANPVMTMLKNFAENYEGNESTYIDKDGDEIISSYRILLVANKASDFDSWVVLNSLVEEITKLKIVKTARELISLSFRCGVKTVKTVELPQYAKFTCSKSLKKVL